MQLTFLLFLQRLSGPWFYRLAVLFSAFGELILPAFILFIIYWNLSKKKAFAALGALIGALLPANLLKAALRCPRPFQAHPALISPRLLSSATGYSFPSGHATTASSVYPSLALSFRKTWLKVLALALVIGISLSRLYLGVHWPVDVMAGTLLGLASAVALTGLMGRLWDDKDVFPALTRTAGSVSLFLSVVLSMLVDGGSVDFTAWGDLCTLFAMAGSTLLGMEAERKFARFDETEGSPGKKTLRTVIGLSSTVLVAYVFQQLPLPHKASTFVTIAMTMYWATFLYPLAGIKLRLFSETA